MAPPSAYTSAFSVIGDRLYSIAGNCSAADGERGYSSHNGTGISAAH